MKIPYGRSNFEEIRRRGFFYVDKTPYLPMLESDESGYAYLLFLRPRRMGKSLLASMLEHYYDLGRAHQFDELFRGLWVHEHPTPERNAYLVLPLDFSPVATDRGHEALIETFLSAVKQRVHGLALAYRDRVPTLGRVADRIEKFRYPEELMGELLSAVSIDGHKLYIIIDEYDHFANRLLAEGARDVYESAITRAGFVRTFFATLKMGTQSGAVARIFVTGVSPLMLDDLSSGFNIITNISGHPRFNALAGFDRAEVERAVDELLTASPHFKNDPRIGDREVLLDVLTRHYNGYRFAEGVNQKVFNSDMVLYFLRELKNRDRYPSSMLDVNVRTDYQRFERIGALSGAPSAMRREVLEKIMAQGFVDSMLVESFGFWTTPSRDKLISLLHYLGMLTLGEQPPDSAVPRFEIPNQVIRELQWEHLATMLAEQDNIKIDTLDLEVALKALAIDGDIAPFITLFHERAVKAMGLKDMRKLDERSLKLMMMAFISLSRIFHVLSEKEFSQGYCDLFLGASQHLPAAKYAWMLELKYLPTDADPAAIEAAFAQAKAQLDRYASDPALVPMLVGPRSLRAGTLVFLGAKEIQYRPWGAPAA
jgi:hypothetical protein